MEVPKYTQDDRSESYAFLGDISATIARVHGRVDVDDTTLNRWRNAMSLLREFDTLVDDGEVSVDEALNLLRDFDYFEERYPYLGKDNLEEDARAVMVARVEHILALGEGVSAATDVDSFYEYRTEEADHSALLLSDCATDFVKAQDGFNEKFIPRMQTLARAANYYDTLLDYNQDVISGKIEIEKSKELFSRLGRGALRAAAVATPSLVHPLVVKDFASMSLTRVNNRIKHGYTPYSSLSSLSAIVSK